MQVKSATQHRIDIHQSDVAAWFELCKNDIDPAAVQLDYKGSGLVVCIPVSESYLDTFLRSVIPNLPLLGGYQWQVLPYSTDVVGTVSWIEYV